MTNRINYILKKIYHNLNIKKNTFENKKKYNMSIIKNRQYSYIHKNFTSRKYHTYIKAPNNNGDNNNNNNDDDILYMCSILSFCYFTTRININK